MSSLGYHFLTPEHIDPEEIILTLNQDITKLSTEEISIVQELVAKIKSDPSYLTPQEINYLKLIPQEKRTAYLIYRQKFKEYPRKKIVADFPIYLIIEPISICNLRCVMCFQTDKTFSSNKQFMGKMDTSFFRRIIDEAYQGGTKAITLASRGEPTIHPQFVEMLQYCKGKFLELKINTNATKMSEELIHTILDSGVNLLVFSIDSYNKEEYEVIRVNGNFDRVLTNIRNFRQIQEKYYSNAVCKTRVSGVKILKTQDPKRFVHFWQQYCDEVVMVEAEERWDTYSNYVFKEECKPCDYLWERMYIWYDGTCNPCDVDYKSQLSLGSVYHSSIKEIWHGGTFAKLRSLHLNQKRNQLIPCDRCHI